ncbi:MAG: hypothetical protein WC457_04820 [Patescibacteria group bacterium]
MFDNIPQKNSAPPSNLPTEPEDMFAGVEPEAVPEAPTALDAGILRKKNMTAPKMQIAPQDMGETGYATSDPVLGKIIKVIIFLVIAAAVGYGAWRIYAFVNSSDTDKTANVPPVTTPTTTENQDTEETVDTASEQNLGETPDVPSSTVTQTTTTGAQIVVDEWIDTDKDGLTDTREEELTTNSLKPDTDGDGLTDGDEVFIWKTNPLNPDTDGDSYADGEEVKNGYNPLGPGKLFGNPTPTATSSTETTTTASSSVSDEDFVI